MSQQRDETELIIMFTSHVRKQAQRGSNCFEDTLSSKWQNQDSSLGLGNFGACTHKDCTVVAWLASQGTIVEARKSFLSSHPSTSNSVWEVLTLGNGKDLE